MPAGGTSFKFTIEDVKKQLEVLGYDTVPDEKLEEFARDLQLLIEYDQKKSDATLTDCGDSNADFETSHFEKSPDRPRAKSANASFTRKLASRKNCETTTEDSEDQDNTQEVNHRLDRLRLIQSGCEAVSGAGRPEKYYKPPSTARPDLYPQRPNNEPEKSYAPHLPRSFIRPHSSSGLIKPSVHPLTPRASTNQQPVRKTDRVAAFNRYSQEWGMNKTPGEKHRNKLRWHIREQMAISEEIVKKGAQRPAMPPSYVPPTEKKRQGLRWEVRHNLANNKPGSHNTQFY